MDQGGDPALPEIFRQRWALDLSRDLVNWEIREICKKGSGRVQLSPQGSRWGGLKEGSFTLRDSKSVLDKRSVSVCGISVRGSWREGSFPGSSES